MGTTRFYTPRAAEARIGLEEMRARASSILPIACPRIVHGNNSVVAATEIALDVDSTGSVQRAAIEHGSGDAALDDVMGALAAQLQLQPPPARAATAVPREPEPPSPLLPAPLERRLLTVSYACATDVGAVDLQLQPG